jgi:hypothetical protein
LNIRKSKVHTGSWKDKYFQYVEDFFTKEYPTIHDALLNWREEKYTSSTGKEKISKMLWQDFQKVEYDIISDKICTYLYKTYQVTPVTVHDALYLTDDDLEKVSESIEDIFWKLIDYQYLDYELPEEQPDNNEPETQLSDEKLLDCIRNTEYTQTPEFQERLAEAKAAARRIKANKRKIKTTLTKEEEDELLYNI